MIAFPEGLSFGGFPSLFDGVWEMNPTLTVRTTGPAPAQRRAAVVAAAKHPRATHHKHKKHAHVQGRPARKGAGPSEDGAGPPAEEHVRGLRKLAMDLKSWLYEWTKTGYEPL